MKKTLKTFIFSLLVWSLGISVVNAYTIVQGEKTQSSGGICKNCYYNKYENGFSNSYVTVPYYITINGNKHVTFCLDPNKTDFSSVNLIAEVSSVSEEPYYRGLYEISKLIAEKYNLNPEKADTNFESANLVFRMFNIVAQQYKGKTSVKETSYSSNEAYNDAKNKVVAGENQLKYIAVLAAQTMAKSENRDSANKALKVFGINKTCSDAECFYKAIFTGNYDESVIKTNLVNSNVETIFMAGIKAAINKVETSKNGVSKISESVSALEKINKYTTYYEHIKYYDISVENFDDDNVLKDLVITPTKISSKASVSITSYSIDGGKNFIKGAPSNEVLKNIKGNSKIIIEVTGKTERNGFNCSNDIIKYSLSYKYTTTYDDYKVMLLKPTEAAKYSAGQNFVTIIEDYAAGNPGADKTVPVNGEMDFGCRQNVCLTDDPDNMSDEEKQECCDEWNNACTTDGTSSYCEYYGNYCAACDTEIVVPTVCTYEEDGTTGEVVAEDMTGYIVSAQQDTNNDDKGDTDNVKVCLLARKKDDAGNSYMAMSNDYCQVYCKEDFQFKFPTGVSVNSGTYFQLDAIITGTKTCYTSEIDVDKYKQDLLDANKDQNTVKQQYTACVDMKVNYDCFEPVIEYEYEEEYNNLLADDKKVFAKEKEYTIKDENGKEISNTYCSAINDDYTCAAGSSLNSGDNGIKYVKSTITKTAIFKTPSVFYQQRPIGNVTIDSTVDNAVVIKGLPIAQNQNKGRYTFTLKLKDIGEFYDQTNCALGRLIGASNSIYNTKYSDKDNNSTGKATYQCYYDVNCPECEFECEGPLCNIEQCDGPSCTATCLGNGCAYDNKYGLSYAYRTISLNNLNPSNRQLGYNWDATKSVKAAETIREIEATAESAYESDPEYSITLTPALISKIKEYNNSQINNGGYANDTLVCRDDAYGNELVNCESKFITDFLQNEITVPADKFTSWLESEYCQNNVCKIGYGMGPSHK